MRILVLDAYAPEGREALRSAGGTEAGLLYERMLKSLAPDAQVEVAYPADPKPALPGGSELLAYDGVAWTGSSLTIHHENDGRVRRQVAFARAVYDAGVPSFGSCWAAQLAVVAAGGRAAPSPKGREFGVSRRITLDASGRGHPLFAGKAGVFDAFTSHQDEVTRLPPGAALLASNAWSRVQAVSVQHGRARFWALQYHPEYDLHEVASLCRLRKQELVDQGSFRSLAAAEAWAEDLEALHADPSQEDLARHLELGRDLLDPDLRTCEVRNWLASLAGSPCPAAMSRGRR
ncbi:MAG: type 1 glutamine amidotransferase [Myxococcota bacterium]|nr:type 1 glutamine amidotransferase [Myxococcota bacterium]